MPTCICISLEPSIDHAKPVQGKKLSRKPFGVRVVHFDRFSLRDLYEQSGSQCGLPDMGKLWIWWKLQIPRGKEPPTVSALSSNHSMDMHGHCSTFCCYKYIAQTICIIYIKAFWFLLHTFWHLCSLVPIASNTGFRTCKSPGYPVDSNENFARWHHPTTQDGTDESTDADDPRNVKPDASRRWSGYQIGWWIFKLPNWLVLLELGILLKDLGCKSLIVPTFF